MTDKTITVTLKLDLDDLAAQFRAAADALTSDRYAANEARQREEAEPGPLDEDDHRDRIDGGGQRWCRMDGGCWHHEGKYPHDFGRCSWTLQQLQGAYGPLTFAPDASPAPQDAAQGAAGGERDAVEGGGPAGPNLNVQTKLPCHECGHGIEQHMGFGCYQPAAGETPECSCTQSVTDIARHLIAQAAGAERERLAQEPDPEPVVLPEGWRLDNGHDLIQPGDPEGARVGVVARDHRSWYAMSATSAEWRVYDTKQQAVNFLRAEAERKATL